MISKAKWRTVEIGSFAKVIRGASPRPKGDPRYYGGNVPRLMVADVTRDGKYVTPQVDFLTEEGAKKSRPVKAGTLAIVCSGVVGVPGILAVDACIHDGFLALQDVDKACDIEFLYYKLSAIQYLFHQSATHGGVFTNLTTDILREFTIELPPLPEQRKIAEILSCWDRAIEKTEELIEKKQSQQNGLMQILLTGETRLKQFKSSPQWQSTCLGDIAQILFSTVDKKTVSGQKAVKLCNYMDVYNNNYITNQLPFMQATASNAEISRYSLKKYDVIITKDSETPEDIASTAVVTEELKNVICGYHLGIIRPDSRKVFGPFLAKLLSYGRTHWQFVKSANGATRFGLGIGDTKNVIITIPVIEEQRAIYEILLSLDREMEMLARKVEFQQKEKKALLNILMSGKMTIS